MANNKMTLQDILNQNQNSNSNPIDPIKVSNEIQIKDIATMGDAVFFEKVAFTFNNNRYVNTFFINEIKDRENSDFSNSDNILFDKDESCILVDDKQIDGEYLSFEIKTDRSEDAPLNDFFLVVDEEIPAGCDILYYILTDDNRMFPIKPNDTEPLHLTRFTTSFRLRAIMCVNGTETPKIRSYAILYHDKFVEDSLGLKDYSYTEVDSGEDVITLIRDNSNEDKLVQVISRLDTVKLTYDSANDNRLDLVEEFSNKGNIKKSENKLIYGDYLNSNGEIEEVLLQIKEKTKF